MSNRGETDKPGDADVVIWHIQETDVDVYRVLKGATVIGEFSGRSISATVFAAALEHSEAGRPVWLKDDFGVRRVNHRDQPG